jgi:hypothetical protein
MRPGVQNMRTGPEANGTAQNRSGSEKHENGNRRRRYRPNRVRERKTRKRDPTPSVPSKMNLGAQNRKTGVLRALGPVYMFCAPGPVFGGTGGVGYRFHVLRSRTRFRRYRGHRVPFSCFSLSDPFSTVPTASGAVFRFCAPRLNIGGTEGVGFRFHVLRS